VRPIAIAAGGTGGHLFPAEALAAELAARGERIVLFTDARSAAYDSPAFSNAERFVLQGAGMAGRSLGAALNGRARGVWRAARWRARRQPGRLDAAAWWGFGGYPAIAPCVAALAWGAPPGAGAARADCGCWGRANRMLASSADALALDLCRRLDMVPHRRMPQWTGSRCARPSAALAGQALRALARGALRLLVTGGSLGARIFADVVPAAVAALPRRCGRG
jgi:UDP-N-acetylglucosamine--N-acetylmuramyl-(pentapeptide) pyrophosphoryl-undecaprenol N-acetylglucosamine transferase